MARVLSQPSHRTSQFTRRHLAWTDVMQSSLRMSQKNFSKHGQTHKIAESPVLSLQDQARRLEADGRRSFGVRYNPREDGLIRDQGYYPYSTLSGSKQYLLYGPTILTDPSELYRAHVIVTSRWAQAIPGVNHCTGMTVDHPRSRNPTVMCLDYEAVKQETRKVNEHQVQDIVCCQTAVQQTSQRGP